VNNLLKTVVLKNISGGLLTVTVGKVRGLHLLAGESKLVSAGTLESPDVARLMKKGFLSVVESKPAPEDKKGKS
jgi:hypothetical protein